MKRNEDDEIQVLGETRRKVSRPSFRWGAIAAILLLGILLYILYFRSETKKDELVDTETATVQPGNDTAFTLSSPNDGDAISITKDSINDVCFRLFALENGKASLKIGLPDTTDTSLFLVVPAADVRKDNQEIVGDYVLDGKQLSHGKRKPGYVAILNGKLFLGASTSDEMLENCIREGGSFLRQYALVIDGEIQANQLKGKSVRRAIACEGNKFYLVESCHRESLYDFSEALADIGMTHAIYLTGGNSYGWYRTGNELHELGSQEAVIYPNSNYILFRKQ